MAVEAQPQARSAMIPIASVRMVDPTRGGAHTINVPEAVRCWRSEFAHPERECRPPVATGEARPRQGLVTAFGSRIAFAGWAGDRGVQYVSIRYTERLADAGIDLSVGSTGDSYDNALAESVIGLFKTEVIRRRGPWK